MAIRKPLELPSGVIVDYHRISKIEVFPAPANFVQITIDLFVSEEKRAAGSPFVYQERLQIPFAMVPLNLMSLGYDLLTQSNGSPFAGAESTQPPEQPQETIAPELEVDPSTVSPGAVVAKPVEEPPAEAKQLPAA